MLIRVKYVYIMDVDKEWEEQEASQSQETGVNLLFFIANVT